MDVKYKFSQNYFSFTKGKVVSPESLGTFLVNERGLWNSYARRCGEPSDVVILGMGYYDRPDCAKVTKRFIEDLVEQGILQEIKPKRKR